ncbi:FHA domain-containing protein [uncultured Serinicoccus sp.]|uniref:FHA domain-containing protein n=1 Tax=uncultured Serinicoccus sp. TaxID=735514 RepID=UPI00260BB400|nr:FHA domain-containing protein [uncultured Serinicoccus sp.]
MAEQLRVEADLTLTVSTSPSEDGAQDDGLTARIRGTGSQIEVMMDRLVGLPLGMGRRQATDLASDIGTLAAEAGLTVVVSGPDGPVLALGDVRSRLLDRAVTGSRHVAVRDRRAALRMMRRSGEAGPSLADLTPPSTPWPPVPLVPTGRPRRVTTTHDPLGRGDPRLVYYLPPGPEQGSPRQTAYLLRGTTTIGSDPGSDVVVPGLAPHHAEVRRNPTDDEYLVHAVDGDVSVAGAVVGEGVVLRTGATVTCGEQRFVYVREEFADHGRPYGGREGGEFSRQRPQRRPERYER